MEISLKEDKDLVEEERQRIVKDVRLFLPLIRNNLSKFEEELKDRWEATIFVYEAKAVILSSILAFVCHPTDLDNYL